MSIRDPNCVFCKIAAGEIPSLRVLDTPSAMAFLDIGPLAEGHLLLIPRNHYRTIDQMPPDELTEVTSCLPSLARAVVKVTGATGYNILQNNGRISGQVVEHVHFHIIPRKEGDGLGYRWNAGKYPPGRAETLHREFTAILG